MEEKIQSIQKYSEGLYPQVNFLQQEICDIETLRKNSKYGLSNVSKIIQRGDSIRPIRETSPDSGKVEKDPCFGENHTPFFEEKF